MVNQNLFAKLGFVTYSLVKLRIRVSSGKLTNVTRLCWRWYNCIVLYTSFTATQVKCISLF